MAPTTISMLKLPPRAAAPVIPGNSPNNDTCATCLTLSPNDPMREVCQASILSSHCFGYFASSPSRLRIDRFDGSSQNHMDQLIPFEIIGVQFLRSVSSRKSTKKELKTFYRQYDSALLAAGHLRTHICKVSFTCTLFVNNM